MVKYIDKLTLVLIVIYINQLEISFYNKIISLEAFIVQCIDKLKFL